MSKYAEEVQSVQQQATLQTGVLYTAGEPFAQSFPTDVMT